MNPRVAPWAGWAMVVALLLSVGLLIALSTGKLLVSQRGALGGSLIYANFNNAWPLVPGSTVRVNGTVAGTVESVELSDEGTAKVALRLLADTPDPRADASVAIRQGDILGDTYADLDLGSAAPRLGERAISTERTVAKPRLDDLFSTFREPQRDGLRALVTELGRATDRRGDDLNAAILALRPGFEALDDLFTEMDGQQTDLGTVVEQSDRLVAQLAASDRSLDRGLVALDGVLGTAAARSANVDRTLAQAPSTLRALRSTLRDVEAVAQRTQPLARTLDRAAPELRAAAPLIAPFARAVAVSIRELEPAVERARRTMVAAEPVTARLKDLSPAEVLLPAAGLLRVLAPVFGEGAKVLFGAKSYGRNTKGEVGLGAIVAERGDPPVTPNEDPRRYMARLAFVLTCETFGVPIRPGCLGDIVGQGVPLDESLIASRAARSATAADADSQRQLLDYLLR